MKAKKERCGTANRTLAKAIAMLWAILPPAPHSAGLSEAQIFEWWDDGIITAEEADEIQKMIDAARKQA